MYSKFLEILACENIHFSTLFAAAQNVPSGEERGETDVFAGYGNFGSVVNGKRFVGSSHWKIPWKSGKSIKVGLFSGWNVSNGISCFIYTFLVVLPVSIVTDSAAILVSHRVTGSAPYRGLLSNGTSFYLSENPFLFPPNFPDFYPNGKPPFEPVEVILYFLEVSLSFIRLLRVVIILLPQ